ncbi:MAG TPA: hypothetical protein PLH72_00625 [Vicinamibacterales bacterium]|nr:hypothetical protein [Vicinamibacterales bacterium]
MTPRRFSFSAGAVATASVILLMAACGGSAPQTPAESAVPPAQGAPAAAAPVVTLIEPALGSSSGHIDLFRWEPVAGADGYRVRVTAAADQRVVWDSPVITGTEVDLPNTVALEPESYYWQVTALKGGQVLVASTPSRFLVTP